MTAPHFPPIEGEDPVNRLRIYDLSEDSLAIEQSCSKKIRSATKIHWAFTINSDNVTPILQSLLPSSALRSLFVCPTGTVSSSQVPNSTYFKLLVFLAANNFPGMNGDGMEAILQPLRGVSREQLDAFFHSIAGPTNKALAENLFYYAIKSGDERIVESLLMKQSLGIDVNRELTTTFQLHSRLTPLEVCYKYRQFAVARILVRRSALFSEALSSEGECIFSLLVESSNTHQIDMKLIRESLDANANIYTMLFEYSLFIEDFKIIDELQRRFPGKDKRRWAYMLVAHLFDTRSTETLYEYICHLSRKDYGSWLQMGFFHRFIWAADYARVAKTVELLIASQIDLNGLNFDDEFWRRYGLGCSGVGIIDIVARKGYLELTHSLRRSGTCLTRNTLLCAIQSGNEELRNEVLHHGADVALETTTRWTRFAIAIQSKNTRIIRRLLQYEALHNVKNPIVFKKIMKAASTSGDTEIVQTLLAVARQNWKSEPEPYLFDTAFGTSVRAGQTETALSLVHGNTGFRPYHLGLAIDHRNVALTQALLHAGIVNIRVEDGGLLESAVLQGDQSLIKTLLSLGVDVNGVDVEGACNSKVGSPLATALEENNLIVAKLLLDAGAIIDWPHDKDCPRNRCKENVKNGCCHDSSYGHEFGREFNMLTRSKDVEVVRLLLYRGADSYNSEALYNAVLSKNYEMSHVLLQAFSQQYPLGRRGYGTTAFALALSFDDAFWMNYLVNKVDTTALVCESKDGDKHGYSGCLSPLGCAMFESQGLSMRNARFLLEHGVDPEVPVYSSSSGAPGKRAPLPFAIKLKNFPMIELLLEFKVDVNRPSATYDGHTPLQLAAEAGSFEIVHLLLEHGAAINSLPNKEAGGTALQFAAKNGHIRVVSLLLEKGANVNAAPSPKFGATALQFAAIGGYIGIVSLLLDKGADVNATPSLVEGRTALEGAAEWGRLDTVKFLLDEGVDVESDDGRRYLRAAKKRAYKNGHYAIVDLLEAYQPDLGPFVQAVFTDREGWIFWGVETRDGFEAWHGEVPARFDQGMFPREGPTASGAMVSDPIDEWFIEPPTFKTGFWAKEGAALQQSRKQR